MIAFRWAAASTLALALLAGCQAKKVEADPTPPSLETPADQVAAAKARYSAMPGVIAGDVDAATAPYAAVSGIDPKSITKDDLLSFIDVETNQVVNHGTLADVSAAGRLIVRFETDAGERAPRKGDLCVKLK